MKKQWEKNSPAMVELVEGLVAGLIFQKRMMFGCPSYFINDNMFSGLHQDNFFIRLSEADRAAIAKESSKVRPFEPMAGRIMKEYVVLPPPLLNDGILSTNG